MIYFLRKNSIDFKFFAVMLISASIYCNTAMAQQGFNTNSPKSTVDVNGSIGAPYREATAATALSALDYTLVITGAGGITVTLPAANTCKNRMYLINNASTSTVTYSVSISDLLTGVSRNYISAKTNDIIQSDGTVWKLINAGNSTTLYNADGTLTDNRNISLADKIINFTSTALSGTSHFTIDGTTVNVDAVNNRLGMGLVAPTNTLEVQAATATSSGVTISNLPNTEYLATDAGGNIITAAGPPDIGVLVTKQRLVTMSPSVLINSASGTYSFRYNGTVAAQKWQIRYNGATTRDISVFTVELWTSPGYSNNSNSGTLTAGAWTDIPGSTGSGANELNVFRIYDLFDGTTFRVEGNLVSGKESMIIEEY
jgi:hypothetical protein